jgi:LmeA-like phospholipid-binding
VLEVLAVVVVLVGLLGAADALARSAAESLLVRHVGDALGSAAQTQVEVRGRFFLPQVVRGAYREVHVVTPAISSGPLRVERVDSTLTDVRVPFHDVLLRDIRAVGIGRAEETAVVTYDDLNHYFAVTGRSLQVAPAPGGRLRLSGRVEVLGDSVDLITVADVVAAEGQLLITPTEIQTSTSLNTAERLLLSQRLRLSVPMGMLPFGQQLTSVHAGERAITLTAIGAAVVLRP